MSNWQWISIGSGNDLSPLRRQATSHYLNQCCPSSLTHMCGTTGRWVNTQRPEQNGLHFTATFSMHFLKWKWLQILSKFHWSLFFPKGPIVYPTLAREFQGFRVWGKFVFQMLELYATSNNLANQVKVGHALDQSRSVQLRGSERAHQNNTQSWRSLRTNY